MAALHQGGPGSQFEQTAAGLLHVHVVLYLEIGEDRGFIEVGRDDVGQGHQPVSEHGFGFTIEQSVTRGGDHDRVADQVGPAVALNRLGNQPHQTRGCQHAGLERGGRQVARQRGELVLDHLPGDRVYRVHAAGILGGQCYDDRSAEDAILVKSLEIGLNSRAASGIGARDGQRDLHAESTVPLSLISTIRDLHRRRGRERRELTLAEGVRLLEEALASGVTVRGAATSPTLEGTPRGMALKERLERAGVELEDVDDDELVRLADTEQPQGIVAVVEPRHWTFDDIPISPSCVVMVLDGVQDPGNVGALARTALALGAAGLVALPGTADLYNPKALRGSMGALFRLPSVISTADAFVSWARGAGLALWTTAANGRPVARGEREGPIALLVGNEGAGVRPELAAVASRSVSVPLGNGVESLNVAVAAGILLYEVTRDR